MRTRLVQWLDQRTTVSGTRCRLRMRVLYGVDVFVDGKWHHTHKNGKACLYQNKDRAEALRAELRKTRGAACPSSQEDSRSDKQEVS